MLAQFPNPVHSVFKCRENLVHLRRGRGVIHAQELELQAGGGEQGSDIVVQGCPNVPQFLGFGELSRFHF